MLQKVRDNISGWLVKSLLWLLVVAFVGTIFLVWGYGKEYGKQPIAWVGGHAIIQAEYQQRYEIMKTHVGKELTPETLRGLDLGNQVIREMIFERLQLMAAKDAGLSVSDEELKSEIALNPDFQVNDVFDKNLYFATLRNNRFTPGQFEELLKNELIVTKLALLISDSVQVTEQEIRNEYNRRNEQVNTRYLSLASAAFEDKVKIVEDHMRDYYKKNRFQFQKPEGRAIEYLYSDPKKWKEKVKVSDEEAKRYYESNLNRFQQKEKVWAKHILVKVPENASGEMVDKLREKAQGYLDEIRNGADFEKMARKFSEGPSAPAGGSLGEFARGTMVPEFERVAFSLKPGDLSDLVRTKFGFHIIQVLTHKKASFIEFEKVADGIKRQLADKKGKKEAKTRLNSAVKSKDNKDADWREIARSHGFQYNQKTARIGKPLETGTDLTKLVNRAFSMEPGDATSAIKLENGYYAVRLKEKIPSRFQEFSDVKSEIEKRLVSEKSATLARKTASEILQRLRGGTQLRTEAANLGLGVKESGFFTRTRFASGIPSKPDILKEAFYMEEGSFEVMFSGDTHYIIEVIGKEPADKAGYQSAREEIKESLLIRKRFEMLTDWRQSLWRAAEEQGLIEIKPELL